MIRLSRFLLAFLFLFLSCKKECPDGNCNTIECPFCPDVAVLVYPLNNEACEPGAILGNNQATVVLEWQYAFNADKYGVNISNQQTGQSQTFSNIISNQQEVTLERAQAYWWTVTSFNQRSNIDQTSKIFQFYLQGDGIQNYAPFAPTLLTPESGKTIGSGETLFSWEANDLDGDSLTYTLFVDTIDGKQTPPSSQINFSSTQKVLNLEGGKQYFYRVEASDGLNTSSSVTRSFRTN
jgi:hypothetical protein